MQKVKLAFIEKTKKKQRAFKNLAADFTSFI